MPQNNKKQNGFTLLELSIVLVILGLITGGILTGRYLIQSSEIRAAMSEIERYSTMINVFRTKYNALPGDFLEAETIWGSYGDCGSSGTLDGTTCQGNGNGQITCFNSYGECYLAWQHLGLAQILPGQYAGATPHLGKAVTNVLPTSKLHNYTYLIAYNSSGAQPLLQIERHYLQFEGISDSGGAFTALTPGEANSLDTKMDDGKPSQGNVRIGDGSLTNCVSGSGSSMVYVGGTSGEVAGCPSMYFRMAF